MLNRWIRAFLDFVAPVPPQPAHARHSDAHDGLPDTGPPELRRARALIAAVDKGGLPLNPAIVNQIARGLGLEVSSKAPIDETVARIRQALGRSLGSAVSCGAAESNDAAKEGPASADVSGQSGDKAV